MHNSKSRWHSFSNAFQGIAYLLKTQKNTWIYLPISIIVIVAGFFFRIKQWEWVALVICLGMVWALEGINTALETDVDLSTPEIHPLAKISKDSAAAGVLLVAIMSAVVGLIIFVPYVIAFFKGG